MPQIIPAIVAYAIPASAATAFTIGATAVTYASIISTVLVAAGSYAMASSMGSSPTFGNLEGQVNGKMQMSKETTPTMRVIYGTQRVSGPIAYAATSGNKNVELDLIILLAGHKCNVSSSAGHRGVYINDVLAIDENNNVNFPFSSANLAVLFKQGTSNQTAVSITTPEWATTPPFTRSFSDIAYIHAHLIHDPQVFAGGIPNISVVVEGKLCLDVTNIGGAKRFTSNPADILYDYLTDEFGASADEIDLDSFAAASVICDTIVTGSSGQYSQKRYDCNMTFMTSEKPVSIIENILKSCYGKLIYSNGLFSMKAGAYSYPQVTLNENDLRAGISVTTKSPSAQAYNSITGLYIDGETITSSFQSAEFVPYTSSYYLSEDNNIESVYNIELLSVTNQRQARRLAKLALLDSRNDMVVNYPCKPSGLILNAGDTVLLNNTNMGFVTKSFEVTALSINSDLSVDLTLKETSADIYAWAESDQDVDRDISENTTLPDPFLVDAISNFTASNAMSIDRDGTVFPAATLTWDNSGSGSIASIELDYKEQASASWTSLAKLAGAADEFTTLDVTAGIQYNFRARQYNYVGVYSPYASSSLLVVGDNVAPQTPSGISATGGTGSFAVNWTNAAVDTDYNFTKIWFNNVNNTSTWTFEGSVSGTTWNKTVSSGSTYYVWLQNVDTSGNMSGTSSFASAVVTSIGAGSTGPSGSAGPSGSNGVAGNISYDIYRRSATTPATPTGNLTPAFWNTSIPADDGNALWQSNGLISGSDGITLIGSWSTPERLTGKVSWYQTSAPTGATTSSIAQGDLWWDTDDNYKPYRFISTSNSGSWQPVDDGRINPMSQSLVNFGGEYALTVTASGTPRIAGFRIINQSGAASDFTVQADTFRIYNTTQNTVSQTFFADAQGVYMPQAFIRELDAVKITAGTISATVLLTAARLESPEITASGIMINDDNGLRYKDNNGNFIITGGSANGENNGAQIDLVGSGGAATGSKGTLVLSACNVGTTAGDGTIRFRTAATEQAILQRDGTFELNHSSTDNGFKGASIRFGTSTASTDRAISCNFAADGACLTYAGGTGVTGTLVASESHRWVDSGNNNELMALTTGGNLYVQTDVYADAFNSPSSIKYKENIQPLLKATDIINALQPKTFDWKDGSKKADVGLIAEQVAEIIPNIVSYKDGEVSGLDYAKLTPFLIAAIQEQNVLIENMRLRLGVLEKR